MLVVGFPAGAFGTNCYVVAPEPGGECVVIDPGMEAPEPLESALSEHGLRPVAVLLTHGHLDHTASAAPVCDAYGIPAYIHPADRAQLADPRSGMSADIAAALAAVELPDAEPDDVRDLVGGERLLLAGLTIDVDHCPGHTPGSVAFRTGDAADPHVFSGDTLFAGTIGRTDLPGSDPAAMTSTLTRVFLLLPEATAVWPGHGPASTIGRERVGNPYLRDLAA